VAEAVECLLCKCKIKFKPPVPSKKKKKSQALVAHTCNLTTQEAEMRSSWFKASPGKKFKRPYIEKTHHKKRTSGVAQGVDLTSKSQYCKKKKKKKRERETGRD
jgi:hypothetical protein